MSFVLVLLCQLVTYVRYCLGLIMSLESGHVAKVLQESWDAAGLHAVCAPVRGINLQLIALPCIAGPAPILHFCAEQQANQCEGR